MRFCICLLKSVSHSLLLCAVRRWAGAYELAKGSYTLVVPKGPDASMTLVFMHKLAASKKKVVKSGDGKETK